jgi:hypothetical protein
MDELGKVIDELFYKVTYGPIGEATLWEHKLRLHLKPKPVWCPLGLWLKIVALVLVQSFEATSEFMSPNLPQR